MREKIVKSTKKRKRPNDLPDSKALFLPLLCNFANETIIKIYESTCNQKLVP